MDNSDLPPHLQEKLSQIARLLGRAAARELCQQAKTPLPDSVKQENGKKKLLKGDNTT